MLRPANRKRARLTNGISRLSTPQEHDGNRYGHHRSSAFPSVLTSSLYLLSHNLQCSSFKGGVLQRWIILTIPLSLNLFRFMAFITFPPPNRQPIPRSLRIYRTPWSLWSDSHPSTSCGQPCAITNRPPGNIELSIF